MSVGVLIIEQFEVIGINLLQFRGCVGYEIYVCCKQGCEWGFCYMPPMMHLK